MVLQCINGVSSNPIEGRTKIYQLRYNSNTVWFNFQTYIYIYIIQKVWPWIIVGKMCGKCYAPCILKTTFVYMYLKKILYSFYILLSLFSSWIYSWYTVPWKLSNNQSINPGHIWKREITFIKDLFPNTRHRNIINQMSIVF